MILVIRNGSILGIIVVALFSMCHNKKVFIEFTHSLLIILDIPTLAYIIIQVGITEDIVNQRK